MPLLVQPSTKQWGKADRTLLHQLIAKGSVDIEDLSTAIIDSVQKQHSGHRSQQKFWRNFKDFSASYDLELGLARAR
jgi:hypothetical protein